jgi:hypothetical protein
VDNIVAGLDQHGGVGLILGFDYLKN